MEELALTTCMLAAVAAYWLMLFFADVAGLFLGLGWRHFSKRRAAARKLKSAHHG